MQPTTAESEKPISSENAAALPAQVAAVLRAIGPGDWRAIARFSGLLSWLQLDVSQQVTLDLKAVLQL